MDGHVAFLIYNIIAYKIMLIHTEVPESIGGRGIGGQLAQAALKYARARQLTVILLCPFVIDYLKRHQEYLPLIDAAYRARVLTQTPAVPQPQKPT